LVSRAQSARGVDADEDDDEAAEEEDIQDECNVTAIVRFEGEGDCTRDEEDDEEEEDEDDEAIHSCVG
jgi:hypothetical protein